MKKIKSNLQSEFKESIEALQDEIAEKKDLICLLESFDSTKPVSEKKWHKLCKTPLRTSNLMAAIVKTNFPKAKDITVESNSVRFKLHGFRCEIPTYDKEGIGIDTNWYKSADSMIMHFSEYIAQKADPAVTEWIRFQKMKNPTASDYLYLVYGNKYIRFSKYIHRIVYLKNKKHIMTVIKEMQSLADKAEKDYRAYVDYCHKNPSFGREEIHSKAALMKEKLLPELKTFTNTFYVFDSSDRGRLCNYSVKEIIKKEELKRKGVKK